MALKSNEGRLKRTASNLRKEQIDGKRLAFLKREELQNSIKILNPSLRKLVLKDVKRLVAQDPQYHM